MRDGIRINRAKSKSDGPAPSLWKGDEASDQSDASIHRSTSAVNLYNRVPETTNAESDVEDNAAADAEREPPIGHDFGRMSVVDSNSRTAPAASPRSMTWAPVDPGGGSPLPGQQRQHLEHALNTNLADVRVHSDQQASVAAKALDARAFTVGRDIYLSAAERSPGSRAEGHLLAHEVAHTVQQGGARPVPGETISVVDPDDPSEHEAEQFADSLESGEVSPVASAGVGAISRAVIQRDPVGTAPPPPTQPAAESALVIPGDLVSTDKEIRCTTREEARAGLLWVKVRMLDLAEQLDDAGQDSLNKMAATTAAEIEKLPGNEPLTPAEIGYLKGYLDISRGAARLALDQSIERFLSLLPSLQPDGGSIARMESLEDALNEQAHKAFQATSVHQLENVIKYQKKISGWNKTVGDYAGKAKDASDKLKSVPAIEKLGKAAEKVKDASKSLKEGLDKVKTVLDIADDVATLAGIDNQSNGTAMMQGINQFRKGFDLCDKVAGKFGKAVPLFNVLWDNYYKVLVEACLKGLEKIAVLQEYHDRELEIGTWLVEGSAVKRSAAGAPLISPLELGKGTFPGGQAVLDYVYGLRFGTGKAAMTDFVRDYFLDRKDMFNEAQIGDEELKSDWSLFSPSTWFSNKNRKTNLEQWIPANIDRVWGLLYGSLGRYIPGP